ncbi:hypothetical protein F3Y22_tig00110174pilonHSYRG00297 [Hibiscus syriacus]|uniref:Uncharacterized protein n=1 Tax=Hibiscus syriacus TaxID=106335 RepID=A0A6A3BFL6_HIBSY|nr:hypothetical protein F3Y22_tig00110174pilonHSYRG00297 [Hibiscus syriacus]
MILSLNSSENSSENFSGKNNIINLTLPFTVTQFTVTQRSTVALCGTATPEDQNPANVDVIVDNQIENSENIGTEADENRAERDLADANDQRVSKASIHYEENGALVVGDCIERSHVEVEEITQIKRCTSMDSSSSAARLFWGFLGDAENPDSSIGAKGNSSISQHLHLSPVPMKRSFSCGASFLSSSKR